MNGRQTVAKCTEMSYGRATRDADGIEDWREARHCFPDKTDGRATGIGVDGLTDSEEPFQPYHCNAVLLKGTLCSRTRMTRVRRSSKTTSTEISPTVNSLHVQFKG